MPELNLNLDDFIFGGAQSSELVHTNASLISAPNINTRSDDAYAFEDRGVGGVSGDLDWTIYWKMTTSLRRYIAPFILSQALGNFKAQEDAGNKFISFSVSTAFNNTKYLSLSQGGPQFTSLRHDTIVSGNQYKTRFIRVGTTLTGYVIDVEGGEGTPGAIIKTIVLALTAADAYQYPHTATTFDDGQTAFATADFGPILDEFEITNGLNLNDFLFSGAQSAEFIHISPSLISAPSVDSRGDDVYAYENRGIGGVSGDFDWTVYFKMTDTLKVVMSPIMFSQGLANLQSQPGNKYVSFWVHRTVVGTKSIVIEQDLHVNGPGYTLVGHNWVSANQYKVRFVRVGTTLTAYLIDVEGGEGAPDAIVKTVARTLSAADSYQYPHIGATFDDGEVAIVAAEFGPLFDGPEVTVSPAYYLQLLRNNRNGRN